jgi:hypothetical protein
MSKFLICGKRARTGNTTYYGVAAQAARRLWIWEVGTLPVSRTKDGWIFTRGATKRGRARTLEQANLAAFMELHS